MRIRSIEYVNYRGLESGRLDFESDMTMIVGKNGAGKTSVLTAVATAITWIVAKLKSEKSLGVYIDELSITNGHNHALIKAEFDDWGTIRIPNKTKAGITKRYTLDIDDLKMYAAAKRAEFEETNFQTSTPIFAFYGVKRAVIDIPLRTKDCNFSLMNAYDDCLKGAANFRNFFIWFRNQEDIENESRRHEVKNSSFSIRELDTFRRALSVFMPKYKDIHVRRRPLRMIVKKEGVALNVNQLSDGEKIFLALIGDLCQKLVLANPTLEDPLLGEGIVMIDELDLHLHPEWQGIFAKRLTDVFPNIQFIVTTHSPQAINRVDTRCLRILQGNEVTTADYGFGMPSSVVLKDIMALSSDVPEEVEKTIADVYSCISEKNIEGAKRMIGKMNELAPKHPELVRLRKLFERLEKNG